MGRRNEFRLKHTRIKDGDPRGPVEASKMKRPGSKRATLAQANGATEPNAGGKAGDLVALRPIQDDPVLLQRLKDNRGYVQNQAHRMAMAFGCDVDDMVQEGLLGIVAAHERYDPGRGANFLTFASWHIRRKMIYYGGRNATQVSMSIKTLKHANIRERSLQGPVEDSNHEDSKDWSHNLQIAEPVACDGDEIALLLREVGDLPEEERHAIVEHWINGRHYRKIGRECGVSHERVRQRCANGIERLRARFKYLEMVGELRGGKA